MEKAAAPKAGRAVPGGDAAAVGPVDAAKETGTKAVDEVVAGNVAVEKETGAKAVGASAAGEALQPHPPSFKMQPLPPATRDLQPHPPAPRAAFEGGALPAAGVTPAEGVPGGGAAVVDEPGEAAGKLAGGPFGGGAPAGDVGAEAPLAGGSSSGKLQTLNPKPYTLNPTP